MKGLLLFAVPLLVAVALVLVQAQDDDVQAFASICKDQYETCKTNRNCCRNMVCRESPFVNKTRCVSSLQDASPVCARLGDLCSRSSNCCTGNRCVLGKCR